ncbi:MAG: ATP-binding protein [Candidatus Margulisiibacteriota bacterium]|nr:ATP-binding protein [Candidatus Margulisiibacteriota bacterium]
MLTTLTIISVFMEIFAAGILAAGAVTFLKDFISLKKLKDLAFSLVFLSLFVYVASTIASQMMFNFGRPLSELILVHKTISTSILLSVLFVWGFIVERFELKKVRLSYPLVLLMVAFFIYQVYGANLNLVYRAGVIEPIVSFSLWVPVTRLFSLSWIILATFSFINAFRNSGGKRVLAIFLGASSVIMLAALFCSFLYLQLGAAEYLLISWILILISSLGFLLSEVIPVDSEDAKRPLHFFRTRVLFKLILIFVLLIVILFETTTLATINISKSALSKAIINSYQRVAQELALEVESFPETPDIEQLQQFVSQVKIDGKGMAFIIDSSGKLVAHPDKKRAIQRERMVENGAVKRLLANRSGGGEYKDEFGDMMVGAYEPIRKFGWGVVVQEPIGSAYYDLRHLETNSLLFVIIGIIMTSLVGIFFARSIERPIKGLTEGTDAVAKGDLKRQVTVDSVDEIGRLSVAFNKMTQDLRDSQERLILSEKLASLGTMAAGMAHEIKNPLVSVRTFTQLLQLKWEDKAFREKFSRIVPQEIERINRIAESLLKFGRPSKPELTKADINALLDEVLLLFESECKKNNVRVTKKLAELPTVPGDPGQLQQVFVNLIKNAIEAMSEKGGELTIKTDIGEVMKLGKMNRQGKIKDGQVVWGEEEDLGKPLPVVFVEITDTGEGIPEENIKSLFDPFFTTKMTGTGMGLPITLRIIEEHKGSLKVRSQPEKGTTFLLTLPQKLSS